MSIIYPFEYAREVNDINDEALRALMVFGEQHVGNNRWAAILTEEYLEAIREHNDLENKKEGASFDKLEAELIQTGAMVVRWLYEIRRERAECVSQQLPLPFVPDGSEE